MKDGNLKMVPWPLSRVLLSCLLKEVQCTEQIAKYPVVGSPQRNLTQFRGMDSICGLQFLEIKVWLYSERETNKAIKAPNPREADKFFYFYSLNGKVGKMTSNAIICHKISVHTTVTDSHQLY